MSIQKTTMSTEVLEVGRDLFTTQYEKLREEIGSRIEQRQQLLTYTVLGAASFAGLGLQAGVSAVTLLCFPPLAFFLAIAWTQHDQRIGEINAFLCLIEDQYMAEIGPGWERYRRSAWKKSRWTLASLVVLPARGLFVGSEMLTLLLGIARYIAEPSLPVVFVVLLIVDSLVLCLSTVVLKRRHAR